MIRVGRTNNLHHHVRDKVQTILIWTDFWSYLNTKQGAWKQQNSKGPNSAVHTEGPPWNQINQHYLLLSRVPQKPLNCCMNVPWCSNKSPYVLLSVKETHLLKLRKLGGIQLLWWLWLTTKSHKLGRTYKNYLSRKQQR